MKLEPSPGVFLELVEGRLNDEEWMAIDVTIPETGTERMSRHDATRLARALLCFAETGELEGWERHESYPWRPAEEVPRCRSVIVEMDHADWTAIREVEVLGSSAEQWMAWTKENRVIRWMPEPWPAAVIRKKAAIETGP